MTHIDCTHRNKTQLSLKLDIWIFTAINFLITTKKCDGMTVETIDTVLSGKKLWREKKCIFFATRNFGHTLGHVSRDKQGLRDSNAIHLAPVACVWWLVLATHYPPHSIHDSHQPIHPRLPPTQSSARIKNHGHPVLRRRVPPLRCRPACHSVAQAPSRLGCDACWVRWRDQPGHPQGGRQGCRHRPRGRALQAAHCLLPVRTSSNVRISVNSPPLMAAGCKNCRFWRVKDRLVAPEIRNGNNWHRSRPPEGGWSVGSSC
jgi:hypothetical protein